MKDVQIFDGYEVFILSKEDVDIQFNGDFLIRAKDVANVLGYQGKNATTNILKFTKGNQVFTVRNSNLLKQGVRKIHNTGEAFITNLALNRVLGKSEMPKAEVFQDWLYEEVLPSIRKNGGFVANDELFIETYLPHANEQTRMMFRATLETVRKQNEAIAIMTPKAEYFDALVERNLLTNFQTTAKEINVGQGELIDWLLKNRYIFRNRRNVLEPYAQYVPELFEIKEWTRNGASGIQTLITPRGRETIRLLMRR